MIEILEVYYIIEYNNVIDIDIFIDTVEYNNIIGWNLYIYI